MVRIGARECQVIRIQDADGTPLTTALVGVVGGDDEISLDEIDDPSVLMDYYFGRGERWIVVEIDGITQEATLDTRWLSGERVWWAQITQTLTSVPAASPIDDVRSLPLGPREPTRTSPVHVGL